MNRTKKRVSFKGENLTKLSKHLKYLYANKIEYLVSASGKNQEFEITVTW